MYHNFTSVILAFVGVPLAVFGSMWLIGEGYKHAKKWFVGEW